MEVIDGSICVPDSAAVAASLVGPGLWKWFAGGWADRCFRHGWTDEREIQRHPTAEDVLGSLVLWTQYVLSC